MLGWGTISENGSISGLLQGAKLDVMHPKFCSDAYPINFNPSKMVCAGKPEGGADACQVNTAGGDKEGGTEGNGTRLRWGGGRSGGKKKPQEEERE